MDFISKGGTTISDKSRTAARKAKEMTELSNLNNQISTQERIINELCLDIGKKVYEKRASFPNAELEEKYTDVSNAYAEIERLKTAIILIKGGKQCPCCKTEVALNFSYCPDCGAAVPNPETTPPIENIVIPPDSVIYYSNQAQK